MLCWAADGAESGRCLLFGYSRLCLTFGWGLRGLLVQKAIPACDIFPRVAHIPGWTIMPKMAFELAKTMRLPIPPACWKNHPPQHGVPCGGRTGHPSAWADSTKSSFSADVEPLGASLGASPLSQAQRCKGSLEDFPAPG